ncbi:unnamed protein product [Cercospora beticola]|nr:unnamed protein product [Cercospora beticola]
MQFKFIAASLAALSVGSAIAGPLPAPVQDDGLVARNAAPVAEPLPEAAPAPETEELDVDLDLARVDHDIKARSINIDLVANWQGQARNWANGRIGTVPTQNQWNNARAWWPNQVFDNNVWGVNNWQNNGWNGNLWYLYWLYYYYYGYYNTWYTYWPTQWTNWNGYCSPGWC